MPKLDFEVIVVESSSMDGSRDKVLQLSVHPQLRIVLEDSPKVKGRAIRMGIRSSRGDFYIIHDADLAVACILRAAPENRAPRV